MSDVSDSVRRWHGAEWWHYTAVLRTLGLGIAMSATLILAWSVQWSEYGCAVLRPGWWVLWAVLGCDVMYYSYVKKYDRWHQYIITLHSARPATHSGIINSYPVTTDNAALTTYTSMGRNIKLLLVKNKWLYFSVNSNRIKLSVGGAGRERPESHKSWQGRGVELVSNMW